MLDEDDMVACVLDLTLADFRKTMESTNRPGTYQDVYYTRYQGYELYVKLTRGANNKTVIISFKHNDRAF